MVTLDTGLVFLCVIELHMVKIIQIYVLLTARLGAHLLKIKIIYA